MNLSEKIFKKQPNDNWLIDLDQYRIKEKIKDKWKGPDNFIKNCKGPWFSDDGEEGVLLHLFEYINDRHKFAVDIGAASGYGGSQVRHLVDKYNWGSTEIDGMLSFPKIHPRVKDEWVTPDNICSLLDKYKTPKEFDLLSLDIDSIDWYVLKKLLEGNFKPSVAIIEFNPMFEYNESYVRRYDLNLEENIVKDGTSRYGASAKAYELLMNKYNYTLIHIFPKGVNNLLFISNDFISPTMKINTIKDMHPTAYIEKHKIIGNRKSICDNDRCFADHPEFDNKKVKEVFIKKYFNNLPISEHSSWKEGKYPEINLEAVKEIFIDQKYFNEFTRKNIS